LLLLLGGNGGVVWAEQRVPSSIAALLVGAAPLWMVTLDAVRPGGNKPNWQTVVGVVIGFLGIVLLISPWQTADQSGSLDTLGVLALLAAALFWSLGSLYSRDAHLPESPLLGTGMEMLAGGAGLMILGTLTGEWGRLDISAITLKSIVSLAYLIIFGALVGFSAYTWLLRVAPTPLVSTYAYVNPLVALFLGYMLGDEPLTLRILVSALIVVSSVALINFARSSSAKTRTELASAPISGND
jgi:drug/metabolite transporter (DMT)-like permease